MLCLWFQQHCGKGFLHPCGTFSVPAQKLSSRAVGSDMFPGRFFPQIGKSLFPAWTSGEAQKTLCPSLMSSPVSACLIWNTASAFTCLHIGFWPWARPAFLPKLFREVCQEIRHGLQRKSRSQQQFQNVCSVVRLMDIMRGTQIGVVWGSIAYGRCRATL